MDRFKFRYPEFCRMSLKPGIGKIYFEKYWADMYPSDQFVDVDKNVNQPPRYFDKLLEDFKPEVYELVKEKRLIAAYKKGGIPFTRLRDKEEHLKLKLKQYERNL